MSMPAPADERWQSGPGLLASTWRYRWWVVAATVLAGAIGFFLSSSQPATYEATARLFLADPRQAAVFGAQRAVDPERYVPQQTERVTSAPAMERAAELFGGELSPGGIEQRIDVEGDIELDLLAITAASGDPQVAAELANAVARAYTEVAQESRLASAREAAEELEAVAADLDDQISRLREVGGEDDEAVVADQVDVLVQQRVDISSRAQQQLVEARVFGSGVDLLEEAVPPRASTSPTPRRDAVLAALLGAALAVAAAYWTAGRRTKIEHRNQPAEILGVPLLGVLPLYKDSRGAGLDQRLTIEAEAQESYEFLLSSVEYAMSAVGARSLLITSAAPGQGKTEVALQLTVTAVLQGRRALLVDGDLRLRSVTHLVDADGGPGLVDLAVSSPRQYRTFVQARPILGGESVLPVLPAGSTADEGASSLRQPGVRRGLKVIAEESDLVFVDSAPLLATADTTTLSSSTDAILLIIRAEGELRDLESLKERLSFIGCPIIGYVYVTAAHSDIGYAFGYGAYRYRHPRHVKSETVGMERDATVGDAHLPDWLRQGGATTEPSDLPPSRPPLARRDDSVPASETERSEGPSAPAPEAADDPANT